MLNVPSCDAGYKIKTIARTASRNDINPKAAHPEPTDRLQRSAADSALEGAADDALRDQHFRKGLPVQVNKRWLSYVDGSGGEYAARVRFRDNTSFLVQLHTKERTPMFRSRKLSKTEKAAMQAELMEIAQTAFDH